MLNLNKLIRLLLILNDLILRLEPFKNQESDNKISNSTILENAKSEKNTYSQLLTEL